VDTNGFQENKYHLSVQSVKVTYGERRKMLNSARNGKGRKGKKDLIKHLQGKRLTRQQAIRAKCYDCDGMGETGKCDIETCSLMPFSPYVKGENRGLQQKTLKTAFLVCLFLIIPIIACAEGSGSKITASWYSAESCEKEGTSGIMANGEVYDDSKMVCASWDYVFGTVLRITNLSTGKRCVVTVTDRGPNKKLYAKGRVIDLSKRAFAEIADCKQGVIPIAVEVIK